MAEALSIVLMVAGGGFFLAGTVGVLRFPDVYTRLHALTKIDNVGLGLVVLGLMVRADDWTVVAELGLIWLFVLVGSTTACHLIARSALHHGVRPGGGAARR